MPSFGLLSASVTVNGRALDEFDVTEREGTSSCWIASEEGMNFEVVSGVEPSHESFAAHVYVDGTYMDGAVFYPRTFRREHSIQGCPISNDSSRLFAFSKIVLTDDDSLVSADRQLNNLGTIEVKFWRAEVIGYSNIDYKEKDLSSNAIMHERSKKMGMHHVALQGTGVYAPRQAVSLRYLDTFPFATFAFRYRPRGFLCAQGIIPTERIENTRSNTMSSQSSSTAAGPSNPTPNRPQERKRKRPQRSSTIAGSSNAENVIDLDDSGDEEIRLIRKSMHDMQARLNALERRKGGNIKKEPKREVVTETPLRMDPNGVIDLSED